MSYASLTLPRNNSSSNWAPKPSHLPEIHFPPFRSAAPKVWLFIYSKLSKPVIGLFLERSAIPMEPLFWRPIEIACSLERGREKRKRKRTFLMRCLPFPWYAKSDKYQAEVNREVTVPYSLVQKIFNMDIRGHKSTRGSPPSFSRYQGNMLILW